MSIDTGEVRAAAFSLLVAGIFMALVLATGSIPLDQFGKLLSVYIESLGALMLVVGTVALFIECARQSVRDRELASPFAIIRTFAATAWRRDLMLSVLTPMLVSAILLAAFNAFKQILLPAAGFTLDGTFEAWDRMLFFGTDPWVLSHAVFSTPAASNVVDAFYHGWFVPMTLGIIVCGFVRNAELRVQYVLSYTFSWIVTGVLLAYLLPSAGPCYFATFVGESPTYSLLMQRLAEQNAALVAGGGDGLSALNKQAALLVHYNSGNLTLGGGISAMPSMHNALAILFALGGMRLSRVLGYVMWAYAVFIWVGSVHLGWHYAVDGVVAAALTVVIWLACGRLATVLLSKRTAAAGAGGEPDMVSKGVTI